jgi:hypothetical protein
MWSIINFGRHEGKSLPQILLCDPDWFFWAMDSGVFENRANLLPEATRLTFMAKHIKIPRPNPREWQISYVISHDAKFLTFEIVENGADYLDETLVVLDDHLDLSFPRLLKTYDKFGYRLLLKKFRYYFFGSERAPLTKKRCEEFFEDRSNFLEQGPSIVPEPITQSETASA